MSLDQMLERFYQWVILTELLSDQSEQLHLAVRDVVILACQEFPQIHCC